MKKTKEFEHTLKVLRAELKQVKHDLRLDKKTYKHNQDPRWERAIREQEAVIIEVTRAISILNR